MPPRAMSEKCEAVFGQALRKNYEVRRKWSDSKIATLAPER